MSTNVILDFLNDLNLNNSSEWMKNNKNRCEEATKLIRKHIMDNSDDFLEIINNPDFSANFTIQGEKLKNVPKEFPDTHLVSEYLKHKSWDMLEDKYIKF